MSELFDRRRIRMFPLAERKHKLDIEKIAVRPGDDVPELAAREQAQVQAAAERIASARHSGSPVILTYGAHLIKNGLAPVVIDLIRNGWVTHVATNGAGSIHDWEFAHIGLSTEDVRANVAEGKFGTWDETGMVIGISLAVGTVDGLGYGHSVGRTIAQDGITIPAPDCLADRIRETLDSGSEEVGALADLLNLVREFGLPEGNLDIPHSHREFSVQYAAWEAGIPFTVHPGIGYDIIYTHPMVSGGPVGRGAVRDFLSYAESVSRLSNGVHLSVGSAIMSPMIFEKSLSMANNLSITETGKPLEDYYLVVVDIQDGGDWDWSRGEPPMDNPAYYLRFCKSFYRMGGSLDYLCMDNIKFMLALNQALARAA